MDEISKSLENDIILYTSILDNQGGFVLSFKYLDRMSRTEINDSSA